MGRVNEDEKEVLDWKSSSSENEESKKKEEIAQCNALLCQVEENKEEQKDLIGDSDNILLKKSSRSSNKNIKNEEIKVGNTKRQTSSTESEHNSNENEESEDEEDVKQNTEDIQFIKMDCLKDITTKEPSKSNSSKSRNNNEDEEEEEEVKETKSKKKSLVSKDKLELSDEINQKLSKSKDIPKRKLSEIRRNYVKTKK